MRLHTTVSGQNLTPLSGKCGRASLIISAAGTLRFLCTSSTNLASESLYPLTCFRQVEERNGGKNWQHRMAWEAEVRSTMPGVKASTFRAERHWVYGNLVRHSSRHRPVRCLAKASWPDARNSHVI
ncbi:hypothetical protein LY78DRAFT_135079 [Colletotrichum sublineola]|nr:hypothetical protein LY78DRAFT_135079 [Colletotrichum sublineola]